MVTVFLRVEVESNRGHAPYHTLLLNSSVYIGIRDTLSHQDGDRVS